MITDDVADAFLKFMDNIFHWFGNVDLCCDKLKKNVHSDSAKAGDVCFNNVGLIESGLVKNHYV